MEKEVFFGGGNMSSAIGVSGEVGCGMSHFKRLLSQKANWPSVNISLYIPFHQLGKAMHSFREKKV